MHPWGGGFDLGSYLVPARHVELAADRVGLDVVDARHVSGRQVQSCGDLHVTQHSDEECVETAVSATFLCPRERSSIVRVDVHVKVFIVPGNDRETREYGEELKNIV